jgi:selenocysteine-specific elongation factor
LVIAADDGVMPQTREHLAILDLFGVANGVVALTKVDRVDGARVREVSAEIAHFLAATPLRAARIFPLDATRADDAGVAALRAHLHSAAATWPRHADDGLFRLAVDRVFTLPGRGTIAAGTVHAGRVSTGDTLAVMPAGTPVRVRSIHAQNREAEVGRAGQRVALNLVGVEKAGLARGDWLADARALKPSTRVDVSFRRLDAGGVRFSELRSLHIHVGTMHRLARALPLQEPGGTSGAGLRAQLVFDAPICAAVGDRFIARDAQALHTLGGGVVLDPVAPARRRRSPERTAYLDAVQGFLGGQGLIAVLRGAAVGVSLQDLMRLVGRAPEGIELPAEARVVDAPGERFVFMEDHWQALHDRALAILREFHASQPDEPGVDSARLRRMTEPNLAAAVWRVLVDELIAGGGMQQSGTWLHVPGHRVTFSDQERVLAGKLLMLIDAGGFDPPWVRNLALSVQATESDVRSVLRKCAIHGEVYQIVHDLFYHGDRVRELSRVLRGLGGAPDAAAGIEAAAFRDAIGIGRKRAIQVLEFFDRVGYSRRTAHGRILRWDGHVFDAP